MNKVIKIKLVLSETSYKHFRQTPVFINLLHKQQRDKIKVGENVLFVNHYIFSRLENYKNIGEYKIEKL